MPLFRWTSRRSYRRCTRTNGRGVVLGMPFCDAERRVPALEDCDDPRQGIPKYPNFLSFRKSARLIVHRDFQWAESRPEQLSQQLEIEIKAITGEIQTIE